MAGVKFNCKVDEEDFVEFSIDGGDLVIDVTNKLVGAEMDNACVFLKKKDALALLNLLEKNKLRFYDDISDIEPSLYRQF